MTTKPRREPAETAEERPEEAEGTETQAAPATRRVVRYVGTSNERLISADDWRQAGVMSSNRRDTSWSVRNGFVIEASDLDFLNGAEFTNLIEHDTDFRVEEVE